MIATVKETIRSWRDLGYGNQIVKKTFGQTLWYWTKYYIFILLAMAGIGVASLVYITPQLSRMAQDKLPDVSFDIKDGKLSTTVPEPYLEGDEDFVFIINTKGKVEDLQAFKSGVILLADSVAIKNENETRIVDLKDVDDVSVTKQAVVDWVSTNQPTILGIGLLALAVLVLIAGGTVWVGKVVAFFLWAVLVWVAAKLMGKVVTYMDSVKLVVYASVMPLFLNLLGSFVQSDALTWITLIVFLFYSVAWSNSLPSVKKK